jgi:hypothetical protein
MTQLLQSESYAVVSVLLHYMTVSFVTNIVFSFIVYMNDGSLCADILFQYISIFLTVLVSNRMAIGSIIVLSSIDIKVNIFISQSRMPQSLPDCRPAVACL